ncbi:MAG: acetylxylan esterase [Lentisphaerae bacterium]|nr:acetylxylan esterase [Lentisphaerota bacterium]
MSNWNINVFSGEVRYRVLRVDGDVQTILFESEPFFGEPTDVFAYMGVPKNDHGLVPGMVCVHGGGGKAFRQWVEMWVERGYAAIAMDLSGRDGNEKRLANGGPEQDHAAKFSTTLAWQYLWTYHAVAAAVRANSILRSIPSVDGGRIGITGISWGGYVTCIAAGVDTRFACAIPVYGCGFLQRNSAEEWMKIFAAMTEAQRQVWHDKCDPSIYLGNAAIPMLFVSGTNDFAYPLDILEMSCALPVGEVTRCIRVEMAHGHEAGWAPKEIGMFADQHLANGTPLPTMGACEYARDSLKAGFTSGCPVSHACLVYTMCRSGWQDRKWRTAAATLSDGVVEAALPEDVSACFLAIEDDRGAYVNTPYLEVGENTAEPAVATYR